MAKVSKKQYRAKCWISDGKQNWKAGELVPDSVAQDAPGAVELVEDARQAMPDESPETPQSDDTAEEPAASSEAEGGQ